MARKTARPQSALKRKADRGPGKRLTFADRYRLLETHKAHPDWSYAVLAEHCGVNVETARHTCVAASRSAVDLMAAYAAPMLKRWIDATRQAAHRGDHRPARDWLLHAGSIDPLPEVQRGASAQVIVINAPLPGMPGAEVRQVLTGVPGAEHTNTIEVTNMARPETVPHTKT